MRALLLLVLLIGAGAPAGLAIDGQPFAQNEVVDARGLPDVGGGAAILITLTPPASARLAALTRAHVGDKLIVSVDGAMVAEPVVNEEIAGGALQISGSFSLAEAVAIARRISGKDPLPDSLEE
ncbi:MAG: hypothetical protein H0X36_04255 [Sphingomonadaceae bacterium]|nr:hypothetical protein [Sphingomonadaceae bacterium]